MSEEELKQMDKEELLGVIKAQRFEISILKDDKEHLGEFLKEKDEEIERLNNIINELEKDMIFDMNDYGKDLDIQTGNIYLEYYRGYCQNGKDYYDKLQELKGSDKE